MSNGRQQHPEHYDPSFCQAVHQDIEEAQGQILSKLDKIDARLFKDNGTLSIQTRLDRLHVAQMQNQWFIRAVAVAVIGQAVLIISRFILG